MNASRTRSARIIRFNGLVRCRLPIASDLIAERYDGTHITQSLKHDDLDSVSYDGFETGVGASSRLEITRSTMP
jgi:hypothetical protein